MQTNLNTLRDELALRNKRGITFILAATVYWLVVGIAGYSLPPSKAFIVSVWSTGILFPLSVLFARVSRIDIFFKNELTPLGVWANVFQLFFFPLFFVSAKANIAFPPVIMGVLAGAHFVFYHWLYRSRTYLVMAFALSLNSYVTGWLLSTNVYASVGFSNSALLLLGTLFLYMENRSPEISSSTTKPVLQ